MDGVELAEGCVAAPASPIPCIGVGVKRAIRVEWQGVWLRFSADLEGSRLPEAMLAMQVIMDAFRRDEVAT